MISRTRSEIIRAQVGVQIAIWDSERGEQVRLAKEYGKPPSGSVTAGAVITVHEIPDLITLLIEIKDAIGEANRDQAKTVHQEKV